MQEEPQRKFVLSIEIQADDWTNLIMALEKVFISIKSVDNERCEIIGGGYSSGYRATSRRNDEMSHDKYFKDLDKYIQERIP